MTAKLDSFFCEECGGGLFYVLCLDGELLLLCRNCAAISIPATDKNIKEAEKEGEN